MSILVIVECRDRKGPADVRWINEIHGKQRDVEADRAVAVSRGGFTEGAVNAAAATGIDLRTVEEVDLAEPFDWLGVRHAAIRRQFVEYGRAQIFTEGEGSLPPMVLPSDELAPTMLSPHAPVLICASGFMFHSIHDAWLGLRPEIRALAYETAAGATRVPWPFDLTYPPGERYRVRTTKGTLTVERISLVTEIWTAVERLPVSRLLRYRGTRTTLSEYAEVDRHHEGQDLVLGLQKADRALAVSFRVR